MAKCRPTFKSILAEVARGGERSPLFWWLVDHHDEVIEQAAGKRLQWIPLCVRFAEHGLTDVRGRPPTPRTARETWWQARRTVRAARAQKEALDGATSAHRNYPSRKSPEWRPQAAPPSQLPAVVGSGKNAIAPAPFANPPARIESAGRETPVPPDAPMVFQTVDTEGNELPEGKVFFQDKVMSRHVAEQIERFLRYARGEDYYR